jgi:hypothetical protein
LPSKTKFAWEDRIKGLDFSNRKLMLNILWLINLDDHQKTRLRYILHKSVEDNNEPKDEIMGLMLMAELERMENAETEYSE